jgi:hypothetical protein
MKKKILFIAVVMLMVGIFSSAKKNCRNCKIIPACTRENIKYKERMPAKTGPEPGVDFSPMNFILFNI